MQVENESLMIKDKAFNKKDWKFSKGKIKTEGLYDISKWDRITKKETEPENYQLNELHKPRDPDFDEDEDQKIAYELLHKYNKDKEFIKKDLKELKFINMNKKEAIYGAGEEQSKKIPSGNDDFVTRMELRQKERKEQKDKRRRETMKKKEEEKNKREEENRKIKANLDLEGVMIDSPKAKGKRNKIKSNNYHQITGRKEPEIPPINKISAESIQKLVSEAQSDCDIKLNKIRQTMKNCEEETKQYSEEVERIKEMVKKEVEERKKLDRLQKYKEQERMRKKEYEIEQKRLQKERIRVEK